MRWRNVRRLARMSGQGHEEPKASSARTTASGRQRTILDSCRFALALTFAHFVVASDHTRQMSTRSQHQTEYEPYAAMYRSGRTTSHQVEYNPLAEQLGGASDPRYRQR
jgi:hypothetical protein